MPKINSSGVEIYYEETGEGVPILFLHEFLNDYTGWQDQIRYFARDYRCITFSARGFPPSDAPGDESAYSQDIFNADAIAVLDHLGIERAHLIGLSMGAYTALQLAIHHRERVFSVIAASGASGGFEPTRKAYETETRAGAAQLETLEDMPGTGMASGPTRIQLKRKDPFAWHRNAETISARPLKPAAMTLRQVQVGRVPAFALEKELKALETPVLLMVGDEDESCLDVNLWLKRNMVCARLAVLPGCGHVLNLEEPALFNQLVERFISSVDRGTWKSRDPGTLSGKAGATAVGIGGEVKFY